ncbi:MAG: hypothetical protein U7126_15315 [Microcoleus sp.]
MPTADLLPIAEDEIKEAKGKKGIQSITVSATVDPTSYTQFKVREDLIAHFGISPVAKSIVDSDQLFVAKKKTKTASTAKSPVTISSGGGGSMSSGTSKIIGRAIKIPTGGGYSRKGKGGDKVINEVTIRVPSCMSLLAIALWINSAFTGTTKKPSYFKTPAGTRVILDSSFENKAKLANKKNE